ncbi:MAG: DUF2905 family protein [Burkholderiaceae bacterium]
MTKWLITVVIALLVFSGLQNMLARIGFGRLPGDFEFRIRGRRISLPLTSTLLLSALAALVAAFL